MIGANTDLLRALCTMADISLERGGRKQGQQGKAVAKTVAEVRRADLYSNRILIRVEQINAPLEKKLKFRSIATTTSDQR